MVTLCHLRKFLADLETLMRKASDDTWEVSSPVVQWFFEVFNAFTDAAENDSILQKVSDEKLLNEVPRTRLRRRFLTAVGQAAADYRQTTYAKDLGGFGTIKNVQVIHFCRKVRAILDVSIESNRRSDGLRHSYNTLLFTPDGKGLEVQRLPEMLEGQVAYLDSGDIDPVAVRELVAALYSSSLFRSDQKSFLLQPPARPASFLRKNTFSADKIQGNVLLEALQRAGERSVIQADLQGALHFHPALVNQRALIERLQLLEDNPEWAVLVREYRDETLALYEEVFSHRSFTGRAGSMYGYEGLGCIYWHQVSKLLLAVQNVATKYSDEPAGAELAATYERIREGLGAAKSTRLHGAFPTDPYSHTPAHAGAQQPGMTGQVKEGVLLRFGELGVRLDCGELVFAPRLLRCDEFLDEAAQWNTPSVRGEMRQVELASGSLAFTYCQVPIVYRPVPGNCETRVYAADGSVKTFAGNRLSSELSQKILLRSGDVERVEVDFPAEWVRALRDPLAA